MPPVLTALAGNSMLRPSFGVGDVTIYQFSGVVPCVQNFDTTLEHTRDEERQHQEHCGRGNYGEDRLFEQEGEVETAIAVGSRAEPVLDVDGAFCHGDKIDASRNVAQTPLELCRLAIETPGQPPNHATRPPKVGAKH